MAPRFGQAHALYQRDTVALPAKLLQSIPTCAQKCVSSAVTSSLVPSRCSNPNDAQCLCSHYSTSGYTLGELALSCIYGHCSEDVINFSQTSVFSLCSGYSSAVSATHSRLTLTTMAPASTTATSPASLSQIPSSASPQITSNSVKSENSTTSVAPATSTLISVPTSSVPSASAATSDAATATPTGPSKVLTTGQTVGVSVASIAIVALLFGLCFFCCCCVRHRKKEKKKTGTPTRKWFKSSHRLDFQDQSSPTGSRFFSQGDSRHVKSTPDGPPRPQRSLHTNSTRSLRSSLNSFTKSPEVMTQRRFRPSVRPQREWWRETSRPDIRQVPEGLKSHRASISSPNHGQTQSSKLPASITNITLNLKKASRQLRPDSAATRWTVFEEDCKSPTHKKELPAPPCPPRPIYLSPVHPPPGPSFADQFTTSPDEMANSGLMLQIPRKPLRQDKVSAPNGISLSTGVPRNDHLSMPPGSAASYIPAYYTSSDSRTPVVPKWNSNDHERFSQPHFVPKPLIPKGVRSSWASATTFESVDPDETTPENEVDKQLSPVSYPKVPRPSNQAIPRSPPSTASSRKVTLAAKRRGEDLSLDLGRGLAITNIREAPESPLNKYELKNKKKNQTPQMELKSPLWEPKLTPSRRGDDLFLSVEVKGR